MLRGLSDFAVASLFFTVFVVQMTKAKDMNGVSRLISIILPGNNNTSNHNGYDVLSASSVLSSLYLI